MEVIKSPSKPDGSFASPPHRDVELADAPVTPNRLRWRYAVATAFIILLILAPLDIPIARLAYRYPPSRLVVRILEIIADVAGGGIGVLSLLVVALVVFRTKLSRLPLMVSASLGAGLLADIVKLCVYRARPRTVDLSTATVFSTFHGWFPLVSAGSAGQSFPSGHATTAAGLAFTLAMIYPRGRWGFAALALTTSVSRVIVHAHFPTDVTAGVMLGAGWAFACHLGFAAPVFVWFERVFDKVTNRRADSERSDADSRTAPAESSRVSGVTVGNESHRSPVA